MSGSADAQVQAILGNQQLSKPMDPLATLSGWQDLANKQQQLQNAKLANQTGQASLAAQMQSRHFSNAASLLTLDDNQLVPASKQLLDQELANGVIDQQRYDVFKSQIDQAGQTGNTSQIRTMARQMMIANMPAPEQANLLLNKSGMVNIGGQTVPWTQSGAGTPGGSQVQFSGGLPGQAINNTQSPTYINAGNANFPVGGGAGAPIVNQGFAPSLHDTGGAVTPMLNGQPAGPSTPYTLNPGQSTALQQRLVPDGKGGFEVKEKTIGQWNAGVAAPGTKGAPPGGPLGSGNYPGPPVTSIPQGQPQQLESDQKLYQSDKASVPSLTTGTQSLGKALGALNAVATGSGTEGLAQMRAYASSLGNVLGINTGGLNVQDMNRAELEKYLIDYARQSGTAGRSDEALNTAFKANASGSINNAAAQDVVRTNIGRDRQSIAAALSAPNPQGAGYSAYKADLATKTDPRGFAWDQYTKGQQDQMIQDAGPKGSTARNKLMKAIAMGQKLQLSTGSAFTQPNVNNAPPTGGQPNPLINPPQSSLGSPNG